jgi:hypothetical protein
MSAAELRELLEAELALLSDDEEDDSLEDFTQHESKAENDFNNYHESAITELSGVNEDWNHLMESAALAEARFQGIEKSIINDQALSDYKQVLYSPIENSSIKAANDSEVILDPSQNVENIEIDMTLITELKDLMNSMIEAVERCAPIVPVSHLERKVIVIDLSLLPQLHIDDDNGISYRDSVVNTSRLNNDVISAEEEEAEMQRSLARQRKLDDAEEKLRNDAKAANNEALERRKNMLERKKLMDEELRLLKKERALVKNMIIR